MIGRRTEIPHHTPDQVRGYLDEARTIVSDLELNDDLRPLAFGKAVDLLSAKNIQIEPVQPLGGALIDPRRIGG